MGLWAPLTVRDGRASLLAASLVVVAFVSPAEAQRSFKISGTVCTVESTGTSCTSPPNVQGGDGALKIDFSTASGATLGSTLDLDMGDSSICRTEAWGGSTMHRCPQVFIVNSKNSQTKLRILRCGTYRPLPLPAGAERGDHVLSYTFINVGKYHPYSVLDYSNVNRVIVPPGAMRECMCFCHDTLNCIADGTQQRLYCHDTSPKGAPNSFTAPFASA